MARQPLIDGRPTASADFNGNRWMQQFSAALQNIPLLQLALPATHDSGTYSLFPDAGWAPDWPGPTWLKPSWAERWAQAQKLTVTDQLAMGVRWLDLRVVIGKGENGEGIYIAHSLYGPGIDEVLDQIQAFAQSNPSELVCVEMGRFLNFGGKDSAEHVAFANALQKRFGSMLVPASAGLSATYGSIQAMEGQPNVILFHDNLLRHFTSPPAWLWKGWDADATRSGISGSYWQNPSTNVDQPDALLDALPVCLAARDTSRVYNLGANLSPKDVDYAAYELRFPDGSTQWAISLEDCASGTNSWVNRRFVRNPVPDIDCVVSTDFAIPEVVEGIATRNFVWANQAGDWNGNYFPGENGLTDFYVDTNLVTAESGQMVTGLGFYQKGNRLAPKVQSGWSDWVSVGDWNDHYFGTLNGRYADSNVVVCNPGEVVTGIGLRAKNNRLAITVQSSQPGSSGGTWLMNNYMNGNYFPGKTGLSLFYADTNQVTVPSGWSTVGACIVQKGSNRIAPVLLCIPSS